MPSQSPAQPVFNAPSSLLAPDNSDAVSLSDAGLAMSKRAGDLGNATIDMAQDMITNFAKQFLGEDSKGMTIDFDSASVSAMSGFSAAVQHGSGPNGTLDAAAMSMEESADFVGSGTITTADGHQYTFEVEIHYQSMMEAAVATSTGSSHTSNPVPTQQREQPQHGWNVHFPGSVNDLFNILDSGKLNLLFELHAASDGDDKPQIGKLMMRLLDLVGSPPPNLKKLADAYGQPSTPETAKTDAH